MVKLCGAWAHITCDGCGAAHSKLKRKEDLGAREKKKDKKGSRYGVAELEMRS